MSKKIISVVIPAFNESGNLTKICNDIISSIPEKYNYELLIIDDGSIDNTVEVARSLNRKNEYIKCLSLSRNFGKELATTAGIRSSGGDATIIIDADGQHPPEIISDFIKKWESGYQVVVGIRKSNDNEGLIKKYGSKIFYILLNKFAKVDMIPGSTDFRLIDSEVRETFSQLSESNRITRGLIDWMGYDTEYINFHAKARQFGEAQYNTKKLFKLAVNSFLSLSLIPLYISGYIGVLITTLSFVAGLIIIIENYLLNDPMNWNITGSGSLGILITFLVGVILTSQGLLALYISRIYDDAKGRPLYIINKAKSVF